MRLGGIGYACAAPAPSAVHSSNVPPSNNAVHSTSDPTSSRGPQPPASAASAANAKRTGDARAFHRNPSEAPALAPIHRYGVWPATPCGNA